jgi:CRP/FNR family nitrogen fixation transcriptional regulator
MSLAYEFHAVSPPDATHGEDPLAVLRRSLSGVIRSLEADQHVTTEGAERDSVFGVISGLVRCFRMTPDGRRHITRFVGAGGLIGLGVLSEHPSSAEAVIGSTIVEFRARVLDIKADSDPLVRQAILRSMTAEMTARERIQFRLGRLWADERVADFLLELSDAGGADRASSSISMSRADIADHLGVTIETVSRALHRFQRLGLVRLASARLFTILRGHALRGFAAGDSDEFPQPDARRANRHGEETASAALR